MTERSDPREIERVVQLADKQAIHDVVMRYCRGIDRVDLDAVLACYHPDAEDDHGMFRGTAPEFVAWVRPVLGQFESTMHFIGNHLAELDGDGAFVESYCQAWHRIAGADGGTPMDHVVGLRYVDRFERRDGGPWLIARRKVVVDWSRTDPVTGPVAPTDGRRDGNDPVYSRGGEAVLA